MLKILVLFVVNQKFESVSYLFGKWISKKKGPPASGVDFCLFLPSFDKKIAHYSFCINKMKNKKTTSHVAVFGRACATRNILAFFCVCLTL